MVNFHACSFDILFFLSLFSLTEVDKFYIGITSFL
nr:MAG TPA: hypothetical protein [Caudoviricetes sp.]